MLTNGGRKKHYNNCIVIKIKLINLFRYYKSDNKYVYIHSITLHLHLREIDQRQSTIIFNNVADESIAYNTRFRFLILLIISRCYCTMKNIPVVTINSPGG